MDALDRMMEASNTETSFTSKKAKKAKKGKKKATKKETDQELRLQDLLELQARRKSPPKSK